MDNTTTFGPVFLFLYDWLQKEKGHQHISKPISQPFTF